MLYIFINTHIYIKDLTMSISILVYFHYEFDANIDGFIILDIYICIFSLLYTFYM